MVWRGQGGSCVGVGVLVSVWCLGGGSGLGCLPDLIHCHPRREVVEEMVCLVLEFVGREVERGCVGVILGACFFPPLEDLARSLPVPRVPLTSSCCWCG